MAISQKTIELIRERVNIVDLISETVSLKRSGRNFSGLCPFHPEKTPSFYVREEEGMFHCFGCGKKGSAFDFVMELRGLSFVEAVKLLAARARIEIQEDTPRGKNAGKQSEVRDGRKVALRVACQAAAQVFAEVLQTEGGELARQYLKNRLVSADVIQKFHLGYCPSSADFLRRRIFELTREKSATLIPDIQALDSMLIEIGILKRREQSNELYSSFRDRLIFPIARSDGTLVAFGGRILVNQPERPKYINSTENPIYSKRKTFYGLSQALVPIRQAKHVYVVEGYMDVIAMHQAGFAQTLATCGTALTPDHAKLLGRFGDRVTIVFDGDAAGKKAAASCFPVFLNSGAEVGVVFLPDGEDPSSLLEKTPPESWNAEFSRVITENRKSLLEAYLEHELNASDGSSGVSSGRVAEKFVTHLLEVKNPVECELMLRNSADKLGVSFGALQKLLDEVKQKKSSRNDFQAEDQPPRFENNFTTDFTTDFAGEAELGEGGAYSEASYPSFPQSPRAQYSRKDSWKDSRRGYAGASSAAQTEIVRPPKLASRKATLDTYWRQVAIAVLCEPSLSSQILKLPSLHEGMEGRLGIPDSVQKLLEKMSTAEFKGVSLLIEEAKEPLLALGKTRFVELAELSSEALLRVLQECGLSDEELLQEAVSQSQVGGSFPERVVAQAAQTAERFSLRNRIEVLRGEEGQASSDGEAALRNAQKKLEERRRLEMLKRAQKQA